MPFGLIAVHGTSKIVSTGVCAHLRSSVSEVRCSVLCVLGGLCGELGRLSHLGVFGSVWVGLDPFGRNWTYLGCPKGVFTKQNPSTAAPWAVSLPVPSAAEGSNGLSNGRIAKRTHSVTTAGL